MPQKVYPEAETSSMTMLAGFLSGAVVFLAGMLFEQLVNDRRITHYCDVCLGGDHDAQYSICDRCIWQERARRAEALGFMDEEAPTPPRAA